MVKWSIKKAFHPKQYEKGVYAVSFYQKGKPLVDKYTRFTQVKANSRTQAIKKARKIL